MTKDDLLHRNDLEHFSQSAGKWFEKYGMMLIAGICGVLVVAALAYYVVRSRTATAAAGWTELRNALAAAQRTNSAEDLLGLANHATYKNTAIGAWARLHSAEIRLSNSIFTEFTDRESSAKELQQATDDFSAILGNAAAPPQVRERALYGLASAQETTAKGEAEIAAALKTYQTLLDEFPDTAFKVVVERRIAQLKQDQAKDFYAFFSAQTPSETDPHDGLDSGPGGDASGLEIPGDLRLRDPSAGGPALGAVPTTKPPGVPADGPSLGPLEDPAGLPDGATDGTDTTPDDAE